MALVRRALPLAACVCCLVVSACSSGEDSSAVSAPGVRVEARQAVLVTDAPLGDVVAGELAAGGTATALCFVPRAQTNTGAVGSAVEIESGRLSGFAAVTTLSPDAADRTTVFDVDEDDLRERLPPCRR